VRQKKEKKKRRRRGMRRSRKHESISIPCLRELRSP
jgi:hypothetical protein